MIYNPFDKQIQFHLSRKRVRAALAGKRGGKTECGAVEAVVFQETKPGYTPNDVDPYQGAIIAPTNLMLHSVTLQKFLAYASPCRPDPVPSRGVIEWRDGSKIWIISADRPERLEGKKLSWVWIDEAFQVKEQLYLEAKARVSDLRGHIWLTGSLGVQYPNPKNHWLHRLVKDSSDPNAEVFEWATAENPYFPREELEELKQTLDPRTYRQMFTLDWGIVGGSRVYEDFEEANILDDYTFDPTRETWVSIDWGYAHPMACLFFQYDRLTDTAYLFDEIVESRLTLEKLWERIRSKNYPLTGWICDVAGNQEREQTGISNVRWFWDKYQINFKHRAMAINPGIALVRSYIKDGIGRRRFFVSRRKAPKSLDGMLRYSYSEKDGSIQTENPIKKDDDAVDGIRYFFINRLMERAAGVKINRYA